MTSVLVVDDSRPIRAQIIGLLTGLGFTDITEATNGQEALDKVHDKKPDIITLDWNMPVLDGIEFVIALRKMRGCKKIPVIFCSYEQRIDKIKYALRSGANEYIIKPVTLEALQEKLNVLGIMP